MNSLQILITGAASGIGHGLAQGLAAAGHHILVSDRDLAAATQTAQAIQQQNLHAEAFAIDVCEQETITNAINAQAKPVDVLINCAGLQHVSKLEDFPQEHWDRMIDIMLNGSCRMTRSVLSGMRQQGFGRIINIGSIHSIIASPFKSAYVAAKHGLLGFSKTIALETADTDITINTICPSYVQTPLVEKQIANQAKERGIAEEDVINDIMLKPMPKGVFIGINELVGITKFLISDTAKNITGQEIVVDGGWTIT